MKKTFLAVAVLMMVSSANTSVAQNTTDVAFHDATPGNGFKAPTVRTKKMKSRAEKGYGSIFYKFERSHKILNETKVTGVHMDAVRDFTRSYKNITDTKWFKTEGGYIANFGSNGIDTKIVYDNKGRWFYNLLNYTEANLAPQIRHLVKSKYYDHDIRVVHEYEFANNNTVYVIIIQDQQSNISTLKVSADEIKDITDRE